MFHNAETRFKKMMFWLLTTSVNDDSGCVERARIARIAKRLPT